MTTLDLRQDAGPDQFRGTYGTLPVMARRGVFIGVSAELWPYRTFQRYRRRSGVVMRSTDTFETSWDHARLFETGWPGDLTIWAAASDDSSYLHLAVAGHDLRIGDLGELCREVALRLDPAVG